MRQKSSMVQIWVVYPVCTHPKCQICWLKPGNSIILSELKKPFSWKVNHPKRSHSCLLPLTSMRFWLCACLFLRNVCEICHISCCRNKTGILGWRSEKTETVNGYEAKVNSQVRFLFVLLHIVQIQLSNCTHSHICSYHLIKAHFFNMLFLGVCSI